MQTDSKYTLMVSGTGHAGMEACISNLVEPGDKVVVGNAGIWGERVAEMSKRFRGEIHIQGSMRQDAYSPECYVYEGDVIDLKVAPGKTLSYDLIKKTLEQHKPALLFLCQVTRFGTDRSQQFCNCCCYDDSDSDDTLHLYR